MRRADQSFGRGVISGRAVINPWWNSPSGYPYPRSRSEFVWEPIIIAVDISPETMLCMQNCKFLLEVVIPDLLDVDSRNCEKI